LRERRLSVGWMTGTSSPGERGSKREAGSHPGKGGAPDEEEGSRESWALGGTAR